MQPRIGMPEIASLSRSILIYSLHVQQSYNDTHAVVILLKRVSYHVRTRYPSPHFKLGMPMLLQDRALQEKSKTEQRYIMCFDSGVSPIGFKQWWSSFATSVLLKHCLGLETKLASCSIGMCITFCHRTSLHLPRAFLRCPMLRTCTSEITRTSRTQGWALSFQCSGHPEIGVSSRS